MKVLILTTHLNPGGVSRYVLNLAQGLLGQGNQVLVASSGGSWLKDLESKGITHKHIPIKTKSIASLKIWFSYFALRRIIIEEKIELIHANTRVTQCLADLIYRKLKILYLSAFHGFYKANLFRKLFKFSGVLSLAVSNKVKEHLIRDLKFKQDKIRVVYNGIDREEFLPKQSRRNEYGFKTDDYLIGILGRISEEKGHFLALEAVKILTAQYNNLYLLISGEGRLTAELKKAVTLAQLDQKIRFLKVEAGEFLDLVDLLIVPSRKEGFGYSIVEAFAKGIPVVGYNTGGIAEIIKDRENGILFYNYQPAALASAIEKVMIDKTLRKKIVQGAEKDVSFFSLPRMAKETLKVYQEVVR